jgi:hypothetical protein
MDKDEFSNWLDHPITRDYYARIKAEEDKTRDAWNGIAWTAGNLSEKEYAYHRSRVDTLEFMRNLGFEDLYPKEAE